MSDMLSSRSKNDIYWQKRKFYISVMNSKGGFKERYINQDTAEDVMECYDTYGDHGTLFIPTGREFSSFPPTAGGEKYFADSVARLLRASEDLDNESVEKMLSEGDFGEEAKKLLATGLCNIGAMSKKVLDYYFAACGYVDRKSTDDKEGQAKARSSFAKARAEYEEKISKVFREFGDSIIGSVFDKDDSSPVSDTGSGDLLFEALAEKSGESGFFDDELNDIRLKLKDIRSKSASLETVRDSLQKMLIETYVRKFTYPALRQIMTRAFLEYRLGVDEKLRDLSDYREACYYYTLWMTEEEPVDALTKERITAHFEDEPELIDEEKRFSEITGYVSPEVNNDGKLAELDDLDAILGAADELRDYINTHPGVTDCQSLLSLAGAYGELSAAAEKAEELFVASDRYTKSKAASKIDRQTWLKVFEGWVLADTFCRVAYPILEFIEKASDLTVGEATEELRGILPEISYSSAERGSRLVLQQIILERSGVNALSK